MVSDQTLELARSFELIIQLNFAEHGETILRLESGIKTNAEKINSNFGIFEEEVKRLDDKNKQFTTDVNDKHEYIKDLISTTQTNLQTEIAESCATVKVI